MSLRCDLDVISACFGHHINVVGSGKDVERKNAKDCWYGKRCRRTNCKLNHEERETDSNRKTSGNEKDSSNKENSQGKKNLEQKDRQHPRHNKKHDEVNPFLEETVAQIANMMIDLIQKQLGDVRPLKRNPANSLKRNPDHSTRGRPNY